ncbi:hypothetical protein [Mesorhizobium sp. B2-1-3A]|uniref:hypothetical protein n=1 Tax=Mesorhizobium sp. B2-1-3A TaxID=2589971 RepID=UPI00112B356D|nr:hypothetical protein [Mesorhizobium sp. B2-1-3A]TPM94459.1 hypothetical protein FJ977_20295 [Mesorhizobium sp. B2-1-3A]
MTILIMFFTVIALFGRRRSLACRAMARRHLPGRVAQMPQRLLTLFASTGRHGRDWLVAEVAADCFGMTGKDRNEA